MYAVIDLGSNTVRMNVYHIKKGRLALKDSYKETIGLAAYLENDTLSKEGLDIALDTVIGFLSKLDDRRVNKVYLIATATIRK
ncbi:MAG: phosphatase, partial [Candidatus Izemoplasmataceae bacterium]